MDSFKIGEPIVLGIYKESNYFESINADDFHFKIAYADDPLNSWDYNFTRAIDDNPYWWSEPFYIFKAGIYIFNWINENANLNIKVRIRIMPEYYDTNSSDVLV